MLGRKDAAGIFCGISLYLGSKSNRNHLYTMFESMMEMHQYEEVLAYSAANKLKYTADRRGISVPPKLLYVLN